MPVKSRSNNRILPANSRAVDVATRAIDEITPIQQTRIANAFRPQGSQGILYNRLEQGIKCTCGASAHSMATRLDQDGKLSDQDIFSMLTGAQAGSDAYSPKEDVTVTSPNAPQNRHQIPFTDTHENTEGLVIPLFESESFKDDGAKRAQSLDDIVGEFDVGMLGISDIACPVCFGTGFVGGFSPLHSYRVVLPINSVKVHLDSGGQIDHTKKPWQASVRSFTASLVIPKGAVGLDACRVFCNQDIVPAALTINGVPLTERSILSFAGTTVEIGAEFDDYTIITHFEFQVSTSTESAFFELPKMPQSGDLMQLDSTMPFQVLFSPDIPQLHKQDVIVESQYGRVLVVGSVTPWSTRQKHNLGYEAEVRVAQPQELYNILPRRGRTLSKYQTTVGAHDNGWGRHRT